MSALLASQSEEDACDVAGIARVEGMSKLDLVSRKWHTGKLNCNAIL